ncbi:hypothetical protein [Bacillus sp. FJAT-52991]|uniref:Uncharacterized protein n=1 Tax=Bacillus kandeliae TaxID=3129297 RepID=A0ABZ2NB17_9BACI
MEKQKETTPAETEVENKVLQERIEQVSLLYVDFLEKAIKKPSAVNFNVLQTINDSIRILHHLKKINS